MDEPIFLTFKGNNFTPTTIFLWINGDLERLVEKTGEDMDWTYSAGLPNGSVKRISSRSLCS